MEMQEKMFTVVARFEEMEERCFRSSYKKMLELFKDRVEIIAAEVGVYEGINAKFMLLGCNKLKLYLVDDWSNIVVYTGGPRQSPETMQVIQGIAKFNLRTCCSDDRVTFTGKNSADSAKDFPDGFFDYVYIDGDHLYESVKLDLQLWYPKVKKGGVLGGHDVLMVEVSTALDEFIRENKIDVNAWGKDIAEMPGRSDFWILK